jgi:hypothetical protein
MKYYLMSRIVPRGGAGLFQRDHIMVEMKTGRPIDSDFVPPLQCKLNKKFAKGKLPTFFESPALIATEEFARALGEAGITNVEEFPVTINDEVHHREINGYLFLNVVGRFACMSALQSEYSELVEGIGVVNRLTLDRARIPQLDFFVLDEDTDCMIISERVYSVLLAHQFDDVRFEELAVIEAHNNYKK